jgi:hypothetical protein
MVSRVPDDGRLLAAAAALLDLLRPLSKSRSIPANPRSDTRSRPAPQVVLLDPVGAAFGHAHVRRWKCPTHDRAPTRSTRQAPSIRIGSDALKPSQTKRRLTESSS